MSNMPEVKIGVVAVSRDCFPESLSVTRRENLMKAYQEKYGEEGIYECPICIVESEIHMVQALEDIQKAGCNALAVYLGNFGPEIAETLLESILTGQRCSWQQQRRRAAVCWMAAEMPIAECSMPAIT